MPAQQLDRRRLALAQAVERTRQQHRDRARGRHGLDARLVQIFQVIGGERLELGGQRRPAQIRELLGMQLDRQAQRCGRLEHAPDLGRLEGDGLAKAVDRIDQPRGRRRLQARQADPVQIAVRLALELRRHGMGAQERRLDPDRPQLGQAARDPQHGKLGRLVEAIARLDLERADAFRQERVQPGQGSCQQRCLAGRPGLGHGRADAAARGRDLGIGGAFQAQLELARPVAGEHQVCVAIDQGRGHQPAADIGARPGGQGGWQLGGRPEPGDPAGLDRDRAILDQAIAGPARRQACDPTMAQHAAGQARLLCDGALHLFFS